MRFFLIISLFLFISTTFAQEFSFSGFGAAGFRFTNKNMLNGYNQETYYEGKFQADIKINSKIEAQLDFRGNSVEEPVELKDVSVKFKLSKYFRFKIGHLKLPFGYEQLVHREKLLSIERTILQENISELGFGGREFTLMGYYKHSKKRPEFPYSYYVSFSKDNSLSFSGNGRFVYHGESLNYGVSYMYFNQGGEETIGTHGMGIDISRKQKKYTAALELVYLKDPVENIRRRLQKKEENAYTFGAKLFTSYEFDIDGEFIKKIEPIAVISYYLPNTEISGQNTIQAIVGANFYVHKDVSLRLQGDLRLRKNEHMDSYSTKDSIAMLEVLVRF
ncbi:MAG: hypothetical protein ACEPO8_06235 [Rhodothermaceae bacterium]